MNQQLRHIGAARATLVLLVTAAASFVALLLVVGYSSQPQAAPEPHPVSALETAKPVPAAAGVKKQVAAKRHHAKRATDSFQRMAEQQEARARRALRAAKRHRIGLAPSQRRPAAGAAPVGGVTVPGRNPAARQPAATQAAPSTTARPSSSTPAPTKTTTTQTKTSSSTKQQNTGGTQVP